MATAATPQRYVRVLVFLTKKSTLTLDEMYKHWSEIHGPLVVPWLKRYNVINYTQVHMTPEVKAQAIAAGWPATAAEYDGYGSVLVPELEDFEKALADPFYVEMMEDADKFMDLSKTLVYIAGYETVFI